MQKRVMSLFLVFCILLTILPPPALAAGMDSAETEEDMELVDEPISEIDMEAEALETPDSTIAVQSDESMDIGSSVTYNGVHYVVRNGSLYQGNEKIIADDVTWIVLHGNALYWSKKVDTGSDICRKGLMSDKETVYYHTFTSVEAFDIGEDSLYYLCNGEIVRVNTLTNEEVTLFIDHSYKGFFVDEAGIIHASTQNSENPKIAKSQMVGTSLIITGCEWEDSDSYLSLDERCSYSELLELLPRTLTVYVKGHGKSEIPVQWDTVSDFEDISIHSYDFYPTVSGYSSEVILPHILVNIVEEKATLLSASTQKLGDTKIKERIDQLYSIVGEKYFNVGQTGDSFDMGGCGKKSSGHACSNCLVSNIVKADWFVKSFGSNISASQFPSHNRQPGTNSNYGADGWSCYGFANFAEWYIFRDSNDSSVEVETIGTYDFNESNASEHAKIGDHIRFGAGHSGILLEVNSEGMYVLDSNWLSSYNCLVGKHLIYYSNPRYSQFTIYRATNRSDVDVDTTDSATITIKNDVTIEEISTHTEPSDDAPKATIWTTISSFLKSAYKWITDRINKTKNTVEVLGSVIVNGIKWYLLANNSWIKSTELERIASSLPKPSSHQVIKSVITINPTSYPTGDIRKASFPLAGTIRSTVNLKQVSGTVCDVTGKKSTLYYATTVDTTTYNIRGSSLDNALKFSKLVAGHTYYLEYRAVDITGNSETWRSDDFTVVAAVQNSSTMPSVSVSSISEGQKILVTCSDSSASIHYRVNGGTEKTGTLSLEEEFTTAGVYNVDAWTTRSGYTESSHNYQTVSVARTEQPQISDVVFTANNAYVTLSGIGNVFYTTDGSTPNRQSNHYSGPIYLTSSATIRAIAAEDGKQDSEVSSKAVTVSIPDTPSLSLYNTKAKIAVGKIASVTWPDVPMATSYNATLYYKEESERTLEGIHGTTASFTLDKEGSYTIRVKAVNFLGSSSESTLTVESMPPVTVTVIDRISRSGDMSDSTVAEVQQRINQHDGSAAVQIEGNVISKQTIDYDSTAARPNTPSKKGFTFAGYSINWDTPVTSDTTVYANYEINRYTVEFWNYYGAGSSVNERIGDVQEIMYTASATAPTSGFSVPTGYALGGWSVDNAASECFDYTYVDGNMKLCTSYAWANANLPAIVQIDKVKRDDKCTSYAVNLRYINNNLRDTQARVIISLYSAAGRMVYTQTQDIDLDRFVVGATLNESIQLNYVHKISRVSAVLVQVKNDLTGGAVSEMASTTAIEFPNTSGYWTGWSDWSTNPTYGNDTHQVEQKTQYQYRDKEYTTSDRRNLDGWEWYNRTERVDGWSGWSTNYVEGFENESMKRVVESRYIEPTYRTDYHYYRFYKGRSAPWTHYNSSHPYCEEYWKEGGECPYLKTSGGMKQYGDGYTGNAGVQYWLICDGSTYGGEDAVRRGFISDASWTRQVQTGGGYWEYRYQDTHYTHYFWRWRGWSGWEDNAYSGTSDREVQTQVVYRYRDYRLNYPGYDPNRDSSLEEQTVATYNISGSIPGLTENYSGKKATVLVYKKTNSDPTQEQLEYVEQITVADGNAYSFTVNPKEAISYRETGDYVVTLSMEGCERLVNIDLIEAPKPSYTVTFYTEDGVEFARQSVAANAGVDVNAIGIPEKDGHRFVKWDKSVVNVERDLSVTAVFEKLTYPVVFVDHENRTTTVRDVSYGEPVESFTPDSVEGMTFDHWDGLSTDEMTAITGTAVMTAVWTPQTYTVTFKDLDGKTVGETQTVAYGKSATLPSNIVKDGVVYAWNTMGAAWWCVTQDMNISPYVPPAFTLASPSASVPTDEDVYGLFTVELASEDGSAVYYTIDTPLTEDNVLAYVNDLALNAEAELTGLATLMDTEESEDGEDGYEEGIIDPVTLIRRYEEPITVYAGSTIYAFSADSENNLSPVAAFQYISANSEEDAGPQPNVYTSYFTVTYKANGGTGSMENDSAAEGEQYTLRENLFEAPEGKRFKVWSIESEECAPGSKITVDGDTTVTAVWENIPEEIDPDAPQIVVESKSARAGQVIKVEVSLKNNPGLIAYRFSVSYDSDKLELIDVVNGDFNNVVSPVARNPYIFNWSDGTGGDSTGIVAGVMTFQVKDGAEGTAEIAVAIDDPDELFNAKDETLPFKTVNGAVTIVEFAPGDTNGDGKINTRDVVLLQRHLSGWDVSIVLAAADANGDNKVNTRDTVLLQRYLSGWEVTLGPAQLQSVPTESQTGFDTGAARIVIGSESVHAGEEITIPVRLENHTGLISYRFGIAYDSEKLELLRVQDGDFENIPAPIDKNPYIFNWTDGIGEDATGTVAGLLTFRAKENAVGKANVSVVIKDPDEFFNANDVMIPFDVSDGEIDILPTQTATHEKEKTLASIMEIVVDNGKVTVTVDGDPGAGGRLLVAAYASQKRLVGVAACGADAEGQYTVTLNTAGAEVVTIFLMDSDGKPICAKQEKPIA